MTDKQIIIDICPYQGECSVSGCKRNDDGCFVRQLFEERDRAEKRIIKLNKTIKIKEQECEELREEIKHYKQIAQYHGNLSVKYTNKSAKYKQTLTKIKEIAEENIRIADLEGLNGVYRRGLAEQILQKISEVLQQ